MSPGDLVRYVIAGLFLLLMLARMAIRRPLTADDQRGAWFLLILTVVLVLP